MRQLAGHGGRIRAGEHPGRDARPALAADSLPGLGPSDAAAARLRFADRTPRRCASACVQRTGPATCRDRSADPALAFRDQAGVLLTVSGQLARRDVLVGDRHLTTSLLAAAGAVEIAVHGWDISRSCGILRQIPHGLAADLLELTPLLISGADRGLLFAAAMNADRAAGPGERLVAFLGRDPAHSGG